MKQLILNLIKKIGYSVSRIQPLPHLNFEVIYLDVGSSGGLPPQWQNYYNQKSFKAILVEPDKVEADALIKMYPNAKVMSLALGRVKQTAVLNLTLNRACSSILTPNNEVLGKFPVKKWFEITEKMEVNLFPFEYLVKEQKVEIPDFVKLDVQGFESEVLEGFGNTINNVLCIELETHVKPIYQGQQTLEQMINMLDTKGFFLRHLVQIGIFEEEALEFEAFFVKKPELVESDIDRKKIKFWNDVNRLPNGSYFEDWNKPSRN